MWPKTQKFRHLVASNPGGLICNCNLYDIIAPDGCPAVLLSAILNTTLVAFIKHFYGRYAGMEGTLKTEVIDVNMLPVPDVRRASEGAERKLSAAFERLAKREVGYFLEDAFLDMIPLEKLEKLQDSPPTFPRELRQPDRQELDRDALELIGVARAEVPQVLDRLYKETALVYRRGRILDIRTAANKRKALLLSAPIGAGAMGDGFDATDTKLGP